MNLQGSDIGDLVRAFAALSPKGDHLERRLAELLSPSLLTTSPSGRGQRVPADSPRPLLPSIVPLPEPKFDYDRLRPESDAVDDPVLVTDLVRLEEVGEASESSATPFDSTVSIAPLVPVEPLFARRRVRALLVAMVGTSRPTGPIDTDQVVKLLGRGRPLSTLPRKAIHSLNAGVEVLADLGCAMKSLRADQDDVIARLVDVVGKSRVTVRYFEGCPTRGVETGSGGSVAYVAPNRGTPVLVLSDFGVARTGAGGVRARPSEWAAFAGTLARAGCSAIGLSPYPASKAPRALARLFPILHWDERTTAGAARRSLARGGKS